MQPLSPSGPSGLTEDIAESQSKDGKGDIPSADGEGGKIRSVYESKTINAHTVHKKATPRDFRHCAVAIMLELSGLDWRRAQTWTASCFGTDNEKLQQPETIEPQQSLITTLECVAEACKRSDSGEVRAAALWSLVVSNIAADANVEDIQHFFARFNFEIKGVKLLPYRDPSSKTWTALVSMSSRLAAIQATFQQGSIFGLIPKMDLVIKDGAMEAKSA